MSEGRVISHRRRGLAGNLPVWPTTLIGRAGELDEVRQALGAGSLVTLTGPGGVGKTRLGIEAARQVRRAFADGVWTVELATLTVTCDVAEATARSIDVGDRDRSVAALTDRLQDRQLLLLLDNCEHLLDSCRSLVQKILATAPQVKVIATSRRALQLPGERVVVVHALDVSQPDGHGSDSDAVQLLADRARAAHPEFRLTDENRTAAVQVCQRLDGLPLAIELAATRLRSLSLQQLCDRLEDRFGLLTLGSPAAQARQQTLRGLMDWSRDLCSEAERRLWGVLSIFSGSFDLDAVMAVCTDRAVGMDERTVLDLLDELVAKSIVQAQTVGPRARYRLLETVRQYGSELAGAGSGASELGRAHRDHYLRLAEELQRRWSGPAQSEILDVLRFDEENFAAAIAWSTIRSPDEDCAYRLTASLCHLWIADGRLATARRHLEGALRSGPGGEPRRRALQSAAWTALLQGDGCAADAWLLECSTFEQDAARMGPAPWAQTLRGVRALFAGRAAEAATQLRTAVAAAHTADEPAALVWSLIGLGIALAHDGCPGGARRACDEAEALARRVDDRCAHACVQWVRAVALRLIGDPNRAAARHVRDGLDGISDRNAIATAAGTELLAWISADEGDFERAARALGEADARWGALGISTCDLGPLFEQPAADCRLRTRAGLDARRYETLHREATADRAGSSRTGGRSRGPTAVTKSTLDLTPRERQVAELIAQGLTNRGIAQRLILSPRTVDGHVARLLTRIGATNRTQVAGWMAQHGIESSSAADFGWPVAVRRPAA